MQEARVWAAVGMGRLHAEKPFLNIRDGIAQDICGVREVWYICSHVGLYSLC